SYALTTDFIVQDSNIKMKELLLEETSSGDDFATNYTDINFKPEFVSVKVAASDIKINKELSAIFKSYEQKPQAFVDANANGVGFYIEIRNSINAKKPDWFSTPEQSKNVVSYGVGNSHEEAMLSARRELASTVKTTISSSLDILQTNNTFKTLQEVTQHTQASTDVEFKIGDVSVLHQAEMDGKYYVALCYRCVANG
ncbi:MAG: LPP20 family lipoprotein, partial [Gallionellaceae bacterium]|nr:LPP20 family lipoprotein [Gallionellaceae bacterium]